MSRPLVMFCDDSATIRKSVSSMLSSRYDCRSFPSGEALWEAIQEASPDLVIADVVMGEMSGCALCKKIRGVDRLKNIPLILLTSMTDEESREMGVDAGADDYLYKPVRSHELLTRVGSLLRLRSVTLELETRTAELEHYNRLLQELRQAQKLEAIGRLAAGVAHEINTPVQYVNDSLSFIRDSVAELAGVIGQYQKLREACLEGGLLTEAVQEVLKAEEASEIEYLLEHTPRAIERSLEGVGRVAAIVRSMKAFAHPDQKEKTLADINHSILTTLEIAKSEYKYVADVTTELGELPAVFCHVGDLNQVILNLIVNAAHAIGDTNRSEDARGRIEVRSWVEERNVAISISDTGCGISAENRERIFDPFFTTKEVGRGTGQGLSIARAVVVEKHGGQLTFESEIGKGTTFFIRFPLQDRASVEGQLDA